MPKVLIVDDAAFMRMSIRLILERNGFEVIGEAENGEMGVKMYREHQPDLVTMDITMPVMDGIQALKAIRSEDPNARVVMVSAMGQEHLVKESVINGAKSFVVKPFKDEQIIPVLRKIVAF